MADEKLTALLISNPIDIDPGDLLYAVEDTGTTPISGGAKVSQIMRDQYKIVPSVASNDLTVALKHLDGTDPSADRPLYFKIGDAVRAVTGALSVTKADATDWCNAGAAELATLEIDYFVYLGYNATDGVVIGFSRIPFGRQYSDFSPTTTNEKYCAISTITNAASTDYYAVIGRFAATLSAGAGYTWTVPTFTAINLINAPVFWTRELTFLPVWTNLTIGNATVTAKYQLLSRRMELHVEVILGSSSSVGTNPSHLLPLGRGSGYSAKAVPIVPARFLDADVGAPAYAGLASITATGLSCLLIAQDASGASLRQANVTASVPYTWATSDEIQYDIGYLV